MKISDMSILLVEDNLSITKGLKYSFEKNNYDFVSKSTVKEAKEYIESGKRPDLIILDIVLPDGNGLSLFENTIKRLGVPTIFLTAKDDEETIVKGLNLGAEDYMTKPFGTNELLARVNKILLRYKRQSLIKIKDITFDMDKMTVLKGNEKIELSSLELKLLNLLFLNMNMAVSRNTMLDKIWEWTGNDVDDHTVTVYLKRIREKLGTDIITTIKGIGYRIDDEK